MHGQHVASWTDIAMSPTAFLKKSERLIGARYDSETGRTFERTAAFL